jgi:hypothetical protein
MSSVKEYSAVLSHLLPLMSLQPDQVPFHLEALDKATIELMKLTDISAHFTGEELCNELWLMVHDVLSTKKARSDRETLLQEKLTALVSRLRSRVGHWRITVPVENLSIANKLGLRAGNVKFFRLSRSLCLNMLGDIRARLLSRGSNAGNVESVNNYVETRRKRDLEPLIGKTCAETPVFGRADLAFDQALSQVQEAIGALKLFHYGNDDFHGRYFGIQGSVIPKTPRPMLLRPELRGGVGGRWELVGARYEFQVDARRMKFMKTHGFAKLSKILAKDTRTDLEERIISSVLWFAKATDVVLYGHTEMDVAFRKMRGAKKPKRSQPEMMAPYERVMNLFVSLETLLLFDEHEPIVSNLAQRTAILVGEGYQDRRNIVKFVKEMYRKRSGVIHHGGKDITESELQELMYLTQRAITTLISRSERIRVSSNDSLREWFEKKILA